jgi:hypothetical protein
VGFVQIIERRAPQGQTDSLSRDLPGVVGLVHLEERDVSVYFGCRRFSDFWVSWSFIKGDWIVCVKVL